MRPPKSLALGGHRPALGAWRGNIDKILWVFGDCPSGAAPGIIKLIELLVLSAAQRRPKVAQGEAERNPG